MEALIIFVFVIMGAAIVFGQYIVFKRLVPHWEEVLTKSVDLPKYELLAFLDREVHRRIYFPSFLKRYKETCEKCGVEPTYYGPVVYVFTMWCLCLLFFALIALLEASG